MREVDKSVAHNSIIRTTSQLNSTKLSGYKPVPYRLRSVRSGAQETGGRAPGETPAGDDATATV